MINKQQYSIYRKENMEIFFPSRAEMGALIHRLSYIISQASQILIFSPHLDDAVLSMGSLICHMLTMKKKIEIISVFTQGSDASSPLTKKLLQQAGFVKSQEYFSMRKREDIEAIHQLGKISTQNLGFIDAAWRKNDSGETLYPITTLGVVASNDADLKDKLIEKFRSIKSTFNSKLIFTPLARGKHVDHRFTRDICRDIFPNTVFYQDYPYSDEYPNENDFIAKNKLISVEWTGDFYKTKVQAISHYATQRNSLFKNKSIKLPCEVFYVKKEMIM